MSRFVNKRELAEIIGISERTFTEWQKEPDFPIERLGATRGAENTYDTAAVVRWQIDREVSRRAGKSAKDRLDESRTLLNSFTLAEKAGEVLPVAWVTDAWGKIVSGVRTELLQLPMRWPTEIHVLHGVNVDPDLFQVGIEAALAKLETFDVSEPDLGVARAESEDAFSDAEDDQGDD